MAIESVNNQAVGNDNRPAGKDGYVSPSKAELEDLADELHKAGEKSLKKDDYDRRLEALANEFLPTLSAEDQGRFLGTIFEKDKGATGSWLQGDRLDKLVDNGRIGKDDRQRVLDGVKTGYADQRIEKDKASEFIDTDQTSGGGSSSPSKADLETLADDLHGVGEKSAKKDDYDKRLEALAKDYLPDLGEADRGRFIGVVLEKDKGATGSWLQSDRLDKLADEGRISADDRKLVLDSFDQGYKDKRIDKDKASGFVKTDDPSAAPPKDGNKAPGDVLEDGFKEIGKDENVVYDDVKTVSYPGEYEDGWLRFETKDGDKYAVNEGNAPGAYAVAERKYLDLGQKTVDATRERAGLDSSGDTDLLSLDTTEEVDGHKLKVGDAAMKMMIDEIKDKDGLYDGSAQAEFLRLVEARSAVTNGKFIHPVYENRNISVGGVTITESENLVKLESSDMKEMLDEGAINRKLDAVMRDEQISGLYQKSLKDAVGKIPEEERNGMADKLAKVVESPDYVAEASKLPDADKPRMQADVEDAISQLALLDPQRAKDAGQTFALNALASDIDSAFADPDAIAEGDKVDAVDAGLGAIKNGIDKAGLPFELADQIDGFLKNGDDAAKADFADIAADIGKEGHTQEDIDNVFGNYDFRSGDKDTIRTLYDSLSSNGVLPAVTGAIGITSTVRSLVKDGLGDTPEEQLATAGGLIGMVGSLSDTTKLMGNMIKGIDGSALDLLGVDKSIKSNMGVDTRDGNRAVSTIGGNVADTDIPDASGVKNSDAVLDGLKGAAGSPDGKTLSDGALSRMSKSTLKVMSDYAGKAGGLLGVVTGGMGAASTFADGDASAAEKANAVLGVMSGTLDIAPDVLNAGSKFVSAVGGKAAGAVAERVIGAITRGLGPVGLLLTVASELVSVFVDDVKDKKEAKAQYEWFSKLGEDGVTKGDWNVKYDYAVTTLNKFDEARSYIDNVDSLKDDDWGGRQAPKDRSLFDFHREEFADFKDKWNEDRGADTYVEFLDPDKRKADFKREKDQMDEVKEYMDSHPTYFPGYNDWVLDL